MKNSLPLLYLILCLISCKKSYEVVLPDTARWDQFNDPSASPIPATGRAALEGVYDLSESNDFFGDHVVLKANYSIRNGDTSFHLSGFFGKDIAYFICEGKYLNGSILFNGYWRKMVSTETGLIHLSIASGNGAGLVMSASPVIHAGEITVDGFTGSGQQDPDRKITFTYNRKLNRQPFQILAHRSGGRTSDLLPVSENSVAMILKTPEFGSTGIEVDVRFTKDGIPVLYHDDNINLREVQKCGLVGPLENYTYDQLSTFVRLIHGEKIPTLREALDAVINQTGLTFVWLDTKYIGSIAPVEAIQREYLAKAAAAGRTLDIVIGLPGEDQFKQFLALPDYSNISSLCELTTEDVTKINAKVWAPRFTEGTQVDAVAAIHRQGRKAFVWTLDVPEFITRFVTDGQFDGILSNFPSCVAYNFYVKQ